jgi:hypothetical protein
MYDHQLSFRMQVRQVRHADFKTLTQLHKAKQSRAVASEATDRSILDEKIERIMATRDMLNCVCEQLRDVDRSQTVVSWLTHRLVFAAFDSCPDVFPPPTTTRVPLARRESLSLGTC